MRSISSYVTIEQALVYDQVSNAMGHSLRARTRFLRVCCTQMLTLGSVESVEKLKTIMDGSGWKKLHEKLLTFVTNYSHKVARDNGRNFQI